jgi:hypothetical protein
LCFPIAGDVDPVAKRERRYDLWVT